MSDVTSISDAFLRARRAVQPLNDFPGDVPGDLATAYAVQNRSASRWGEPVVGYKVGGIGPQWREGYPSAWLAGPVFPSLVYRIDKDGEINIPVYDGGFAAYEPELVFILEDVSNVTEPVTSLEAAKTYVKAVHIGAEIASSPLSAINDLGPGSIISDFGNQCGVVIGPEISLDWLNHLGDILVAITIDGELIGQKPVNPGEGGPLDALRFLLNHLQNQAPETALPDSLILSSGAITGVHRAEPGSVSVLDYRPHGSFKVNMVAKAA